MAAKGRAYSVRDVRLLLIVVMSVFIAAFMYLVFVSCSKWSIIQTTLPTLPEANQQPATREGERDFLSIGGKLHTDKVAANDLLEQCLETGQACVRPKSKNPRCRPWGHFYNTLYQSRLGAYSTNHTEPFQFLEIGFFKGGGFETYMEFMPRAEAHSIEISCLPQGPPNTASTNHRYQEFLDSKRLHCADASDVRHLNEVWSKEMNRPDAPPLKIVVDDASHLSPHMAQSMFFWFPRIQPGGLMIMEDIQPIKDANQFRTQFLPQIMADLHFCGDPEVPDEPCFPTLQPLLASIHCEMHICIFERNDQPAQNDLSLELSRTPANALDLRKCKSYA